MADREKRKIGKTSPIVMQKAIDYYVKNQVGIRKTAKHFNIAYQTLHRYIKKYKSGNLERLEPNYATRAVFSKEQENTLHDYLVECAQKFHGLTPKRCRKLAYELALINNIAVPPTWETNKMAGKDWLRGFKKRYRDLSIKKPEACSLSRATAFNKTNVTKFYGNLKEVYKRNPSFADGSRVFNLDETATTTVQKPPKVIALKGKNASKVTSGERGILVTTVCIVNALGQALPPAMIFPRKTFKPNMLYGAPPGTLGLANKTGWVTTDLFVEVLRHFIKFSSASIQNPALLIMDNHESHLSIAALNLAKENGVTVLTLHPHTTNKMQPLDVGLNAPFKAYYNAALDSLMMRNVGKTIGIYHIAECVGQAYPKAMTPVNIINAFKKCGIFPYDDQIFTEVDFLPSSITDRPAPEKSDAEHMDADKTDAEEINTDSEKTDAEDTCSEKTNVKEIHAVKTDVEVSRHSPTIFEDSKSIDVAINSPKTLQQITRNVVVEIFKNTEHGLAEDKSTGITNQTRIKTSSSKTSLADDFVPRPFKNDVGDLPSTSKASTSKSINSSQATPINKLKIKLEPMKCEKAATVKPNTKDQDAKKTLKQRIFLLPSTSGSKPNKFISPQEFCTPLKAGPRKNTTTRKRGRSMIATDTPEKDELAQKKKKVTKKRTKKTTKQQVTKNLFRETKKAKKRPAIPSDTSDEDETIIYVASGSSSGGESFLSGSEDEEVVLTDNFPPLQRVPAENDYIIVRFKSKNETVYFVGKILEIIDDSDDCDYFVSFLKLKSKANQKFIEPIEPDVAGVKMVDVQYILPAPKVQGTNRRKITFKFSVDMSLLKLRY